MKVTKTLLLRKGACDDQLDKFVELFPKGVVVTEALCIEHASVFDWGWAASHLLRAPAQDEYSRVRAAAQAEYERVIAAAWDEYEREMAPAQAEYSRVAAATFGRLEEKE